QLAPLERHLLALYQQCELTLKHQIHLLLTLVAVDAPTLERLQDKLGDPERAHAELTAQGDEPLARGAVHVRAGRAPPPRGQVRTPARRRLKQTASSFFFARKAARACSAVRNRAKCRGTRLGERELHGLACVQARGVEQRHRRVPRSNEQVD